MSEEVHLAAEAVAEVAHATEATGGLGTLGINLKIFIAQLVNFGVVLLVLWKWAYKPVVNLLEQRQEKIAQGIKQAEEVEKRVHNLESEQKKVIAEARAEATSILEEARASADERKGKLLSKAKEEVQSVVQKGKAQLAAEKDQMIRDARDEIAKIAVEASRKILAESVDTKTAQKLAEGVIDEMTG